MFRSLFGFWENKLQMYVYLPHTPLGHGLYNRYIIILYKSPHTSLANGIQQVMCMNMNIMYGL